MRQVGTIAVIALMLWLGHASAATISADNAASMINQDATVCGKVFSFRYNENSEGKPTFLHMGAAFPQHKFALRIDGINRDKFQPSPDALVDKTVCATGRIRAAAGGRPEMTIEAPAVLEVMM